MHFGISDVFQRFLGHLEPLNQPGTLEHFAEFKMASKMAAIGMEIIEMTIFSLLFHSEMYFCVYMFCHPRNMMEWVLIAFGNAKYKMAANLASKMAAVITKISKQLIFPLFLHPEVHY